MHLSSGELRHSSGELWQNSCAASRSSAELDFGSQWVPMVMQSQVTQFGGIWGRFSVLSKLAGAGGNRIMAQVNRITAQVSVYGHAKPSYTVMAFWGRLPVSASSGKPCQSSPSWLCDTSKSLWQRQQVVLRRLPLYR